MKTKFESDDMVESIVEGVKRLTRYKKIHTDLAIPRVLLKSNSRYCNVVQIFYELKVEAILAGCHKSIKLFFPITIGSIPLVIDQTEPAPTVELKLTIPETADPLGEDCSNPSVSLLESRKFKKLLIQIF